MCLCVVIVFPILCVLMSVILPVPSLLSPSVLAMQQQAGLITSEECKGLVEPINVVRVHSGRSPEVVTKAANILKRHGFKEESKLLAGKQTRPLIHVRICGVLYSGA